MSAPTAAEVSAVFSFDLPALPYPGLRPFAKQEWPIFFGRERMADEVVQRLARDHLVAVHGDSGSGKSSLIRAGVLSRLEQEAARGGARWRTCVALPGNAPLTNLAQALAALDGREDDAAHVLELRRALNFGRGAPAALQALLCRDARDHVCLLIDQFEELFAHVRQHGADEARLVTELLIGLLEKPLPGLYAVLTMRSDFLGSCAQFPGFSEAVNTTQYLLPHMTPADLTRAIREPALIYDGEVEAALAERLINEVSGQQDQLPLIQHGLMVLHRDAHLAVGPDGAWRLTLAQYQGSGGLKKLLSDHADAVTQRALTTLPGGALPESRVVEDLFRALTDINPDGRVLRRPQTFARLLAVTGASEPLLRHVLDAFRVEGVSFLRPFGDAPIGPDTEIDVSHEALIRCWQVLAEPEDGWLVREFRNGLMWRALLVQADSYERNPANFLSAATSEERELWMRRRNPAWAERYGGGWTRVTRLIEASVAERRRAELEAEADRKRDEAARLQAQRMRMAGLGAGIILSLMCVLAFLLFKTTRQGEAYRAESEARLEAQEALFAAEREKSAAAARTATELQEVVESLQRAAEYAPTNLELSNVLNRARDTIATQQQAAQQAALPLASFKVAVFTCQGTDKGSALLAENLIRAIRRLGAREVQLKALDPATRERQGAPWDALQVRIDPGIGLERRVAQVLLSQPEFFKAGEWRTVEVSTKNPTPEYLSVFVCPGGT